MLCSGETAPRCSVNKNRNNNPGRILSLSRRKFLLGGAACGGVLLSDAWLRQPKALEISTTRLATEKIPAGRELRIVQLSDLHLDSFNEYFRQVASKTNALKPDMILLTGDYVEEARNLNGVLKFLRLLSAPGGIYAVQGNWEYWALIEGKNLQDKFHRAGATLLINQRGDADIRDLPVSVLGVDYPSASGSLQILRTAADPDRINITLSHVPAFQHGLLDGIADLVLSGHTHGGQVRLPLIKPFYLPRHSGAYVSGLYRVGEKQQVPLYVSRGIGTSVMPVRFFCPPEISLLRLYGA